MSCVTCAKGFGLFNREVACPLCHRELCRSCLSYTVDQTSKRCCGRCYYNITEGRTSSSNAHSIDIQPDALRKLREANMRKNNADPSSRGDVADTGLASTTTCLFPSPSVRKWQPLDETSVTDEAIARRLAKLRGENPVDASKPVLILDAPCKTTREQEEDLLRASMAELELAKKNSAEVYIEKRLEELRKDCPLLLKPKKISFPNTQDSKLPVVGSVEAILEQAQAMIKTASLSEEGLQNVSEEEEESDYDESDDDDEDIPRWD